MIDSGRQRPLGKSNSGPPVSSVKTSYFLRLKNQPFSLLQDVFHRFSIKKPQSQQVNQSIPVEKKNEKINDSFQPLIILRRSAFFLLWTIISIEILFDLILVILRVPTLYFSIPFVTQKEMTIFFFSTFVLITLGKLDLMVFAVLRWITTHYIIGKGEIRYKTGILSKNEKIFSCGLAQEVVYTQSLMGRMCNYGTIEVYNPAIKERIYLDSIPDPNKYVDIIKKNIHGQPEGAYIIERQ